MKRVLFSASTASHISNFHLAYLKSFKENGYEVWVMTNSNQPFECASLSLNVDFQKSLLSYKNIKAIRQVRAIIKENRIDVISTHTSLAGAIVRAAVLLLPEKKRPYVFHTCHGYIFDSNNLIKKWFYLLPEIICSRVTQTLMVMNEEDFLMAKKYHLFKGELKFIPGMGVNFNKFKKYDEIEKEAFRKKWNISSKDYLFLYAAEFSNRKNHLDLITAFSDVCKKNKDVKLLLAGEGILLQEIKDMVLHLDIAKNVLVLGHLSDMSICYTLAHAVVSTSKSEGLPFNIMEAMGYDLPIIASNIKGHRDLLQGNESGFLYDTMSELISFMNMFALERPNADWKSEIQKYDIKNVEPVINQIYFG